MSSKEIVHVKTERSEHMQFKSLTTSSLLKDKVIFWHAHCPAPTDKILIFNVRQAGKVW